MSLINKYLPKFNFTEYHSIRIQASSKECYSTVLDLDLAESRIISFLFKLRGMPFSKTRFKDFTEGARFTLLEENEPHEFLYGFWAKKHIEWIADKEAYIQGGKGYRMLIAWNFEFKELENNECLVSTETRVKCQTTGTKIIFSIYWFFVKPFSGWIRNEMLRLVKKKVNERLSN